MNKFVGEIDPNKKIKKIVWRKIEDISYVNVRPAVVPQINSLAWLEGK